MASFRRFLVDIFFILLSLISWTLLMYHRKDSCKSVVIDQLSNDATGKMSWHEISSAEQVYRYLHWTNSSSCHFAVDFGFYIWNGEGVAAPDGHKAICLDQSVSPVYHDCLVYSFGINYQWSFDDAMEKFGCHVYSFDPSMDVQDHNRSSFIHFYKIGLSDTNHFDPASKWNMKTGSSIYQTLSKLHGVKPIDVFKMDVEFAEWDAIPQMLQSGFLTKRVKQLAVEIHFKANDTLETFKDRVRILQDLESGGRFVRFSSRPNPWLIRSLPVLSGKRNYIGFEMAWYNSRYYNESDFSYSSM